MRAGLYVLALVNTNECAQFSTRIADVAVCRAAAPVLGRTFSVSGTFVSAPRGCYIISTTGAVWFNAHATGAAAADKQLVCYTGTPAPTNFGDTNPPTRAPTSLLTYAPTLLPSFPGGVRHAPSMSPNPLMLPDLCHGTDGTLSGRLGRSRGSRQGLHGLARHCGVGCDVLAETSARTGRVDSRVLAGTGGYSTALAGGRQGRCSGWVPPGTPAVRLGVLECTAAAVGRGPRVPFVVRRCVRVRCFGQQRVPGGHRSDRGRGGVPHRGRRSGQDREFAFRADLAYRTERLLLLRQLQRV